MILEILSSLFVCVCVCECVCVCACRLKVVSIMCVEVSPLLSSLEL